MTTRNVYMARLTTVSFSDTGDNELVLKNLGFGTGMLSAFHDRGAGASPMAHEIKAWIAFETNPLATEHVDVYVCQSDGTDCDGGVTFDATNDQALTEAQAENMKPADQVRASIADTNKRVKHFLVNITARYYAIGFFNKSAADNLKNTDDTSGADVTPLFSQLQSEA